MLHALPEEVRSCLLNAARLCGPSGLKIWAAKTGTSAPEAMTAQRGASSSQSEARGALQYNIHADAAAGGRAVADLS